MQDACSAADMIQRDDMLFPLLVEAGVRGDLQRTAAVCKRWAEVALETSPIVVKQWNMTLQDDLRCIISKDGNCFLGIRRLSRFLSRFQMESWLYSLMRSCFGVV